MGFLASNTVGRVIPFIAVYSVNSPASPGDVMCHLLFDLLKVGDRGYPSAKPQDLLEAYMSPASVSHRVGPRAQNLCLM